MMLDIGTEISIFIAACLTGVFVYLVYCMICIFRRICRHSLFWISVEDLLFWIGTGFFLFSEMFRTCQGMVRWYFVVGALCGVVFSWQIIRILCKNWLRKKKKQDSINM